MFDSFKRDYISQKKKEKQILKENNFKDWEELINKMKEMSTENFYNKYKNIETRLIPQVEYDKWLGKNEPSKEEQLKQKENNFTTKFELMSKEYSMIIDESIEYQTYENYIKTEVEDENYVRAVKESESDYIIFFGVYVDVPPFSFYEICEYLNENDIDMAYCDNDTIIEGGRNYPDFKPDYQKEILTKANYVGNFLIVKTEFLKKNLEILENLNNTFIYDIALRTTEKTDKIKHINKILFNNLLEDMPEEPEDEQKIIREHKERVNDK